MAFIDPSSGIFRIGDQLFEFEGGTQLAKNLRVITPEDVQKRFMTSPATAGLSVQQFIQQIPDVSKDPSAAQRAGIGDVRAGYSSLGDILQAANQASPSTQLQQALQDYKAVEAKQTSPQADIIPGGTAGTAGTGGTPTSIFRDASNNFFAVDAQGNKTPIDINQFHALGLNEKFVHSGQTVPLSQAQTGQVGAPGGSGGTPVDQQAIDALKFVFGWSDTQAQQFLATDPNAKNMSLMAEYLKGQEDKGNLQTQINAQTLNDAYQSALKELNDPNSLLGAKYADLQKTDIANFQNNLKTLQTGVDIQSQGQQTQFQNEQKAAAEAAASAGAAYSGFREQAKKELGTQQSGIVKSSLSDLEQSLRTQFQPLESYYGSQKFGQLFPNAGVSYTNPLTGQTQNVSYTPVGGLMGTEKAQKESDVLNRQQQIFGLTQPQ